MTSGAPSSTAWFEARDIPSITNRNQILSAKRKFEEDDGLLYQPLTDTLYGSDSEIEDLVAEDSGSEFNSDAGDEFHSLLSPFGVRMRNLGASDDEEETTPVRSSAGRKPAAGRKRAAAASARRSEAKREAGPSAPKRSRSARRGGASPAMGLQVPSPSPAGDEALSSPTGFWDVADGAAFEGEGGSGIDERTGLRRRGSDGRALYPTAYRPLEDAEAANLKRPTLRKQLYMAARESLRNAVRAHPSFQSKRRHFLRNVKAVEKLQKERLIEVALEIGLDLAPFAPFIDTAPQPASEATSPTPESPAPQSPAPESPTPTF
eukprot:tig00020930_g16034.t1